MRLPVKPLLQLVGMFCILAGIMSQTYQPKNKKRKRTHGFLSRLKSAAGRRVLKARRQKGRKKLSV